MKILIIRVSAIGDVIHTLPSLFYLKKQLPNCHIEWIVQKKAASLLQDHPLIDRLWAMPDRFLEPKNLQGTFKVLKALRQTKWDAIIDFQGILKTSTLIMFLHGKKYGFDKKNARAKITTLFTHHHTIPEYKNVIQKNLALASEVVFDLQKNMSCPTIQSLTPSLTLHINNIDEHYVNTWLSENNISHPILLSPNTTWKSKHWPLESWKELLVKLSSQIDQNNIILIGKDFGAQGAALAQCIKEKNLPIHLSPKFSLIQTAHLMKKAKLVVAPDTGLLHLADYMGTQSIAIFGPTSKDKHGPFLYQKNIDRGIQISCSHIYQKNHGKNNFDCMKQLSPATLFQKIITAL